MDSRGYTGIQLLAGYEPTQEDARATDHGDPGDKLGGPLNRYSTTQPL